MEAQKQPVKAKMEGTSIKDAAEIEYEQIPLLSSKGFGEIGQEKKFLVVNFEEIDFKDDKGPKPVFRLKDISGDPFKFAVARTNSKYLQEAGFEYFQQVIGKHISIRKEVRTFGENENIGLFIVAVE